MAYGDGTIERLGRDKWRVYIYFGVDPITGKPDRVTRTVSGTKRDAIKVRDQIKRDRENGLTADGNKTTFAEFAEQWQTSREASNELSTRTIKEGRYIIKRVKPYIGDMKLTDITARHIESLYSELRKDSRTGKPLSGTTMRKFHTILKQIMQRAVDLDYILRNPCARVKAPKKDTVERRALTEQQAQKLTKRIDESEAEILREVAEKEQRQFERGNGFGRSQVRGISDLAYLNAIRVVLATGLRRGEVLGLTWHNVDLKRGTIRVEQKLDSYGNIGKPKSEAGRRTLSIGKQTVEHLKRWKKQQAAFLLKLSITQSPDTFVCCSDTGGMSNLNNFGRWWNAWRAPEFDGWKIHELRHTQATHLIKNGVDIKTVQTRLGHSTAALTLDTYAHAVPEKDEEAAEAFEKMLYSEPKEAPIIDALSA